LTDTTQQIVNSNNEQGDILKTDEKTRESEYAQKSRRNQKASLLNYKSSFNINDYRSKRSEENQEANSKFKIHHDSSILITSSCAIDEYSESAPPAPPSSSLTQINSKKPSLQDNKAQVGENSSGSPDSNTNLNNIQNSVSNTSLIGNPSAALEVSVLNPNNHNFSDVEDAMSHSTISNANFKKLISSRNKLPPPNSPTNIPSNYTTYKNHLHHNTNSNFTNNAYANNTYKDSKTNVNNLDQPKQILPNLSAVKKQNMPLRGLAFKEAKQRIMNQSNEFVSDSQFMTSLNNEASNRNNAIKIEPEKKSADSVAISFPVINDVINGKPTYKQMLKGIKKGVTVNNQSLSNFSNEKLETSKLVSNLVTTNRNLSTRQPNLKFDKNGKPVRAQKAKNYIKILKIKGDKIATAEKVTSNLKEVNSHNKKTLILTTKYNTTLNESGLSNLDDNNTNNTSTNQDYQNTDNLNANSRLFSISINNFTQSILNVKRVNSSPNPSPEQC
jgi:hypothetical protein